MKNARLLYLSMLFATLLALSGCMSCESTPEDNPDSGVDSDVGIGDDAGDVGDAGDTATTGDAGDVGDAGDTATTGDAGDAGQPDAGGSLCGDCSSLDDQCNVGVCDEDTGTCMVEPANVGERCDDGLYCTVDASCTADGECKGKRRDCSHLDELCRVGVCDEEHKGCVAVDRAEKTSCDTGQFCVVNEKCSAGECIGEARDCSHLDDSCHEGICDEAAGQCRTIDLCGECEDGIPTADAGDDQEVVPNTQVALDGGDSFDPGGQLLTYEWRIASKPEGSSALLSEPTSVTPTVLADVAGEFEICLTVANEEQCISEESCISITVAPLVDLHIELTWRLDADPAAEPVDLDLHYRTPNGSWFSGLDDYPCRAPDAQADSVWWCVSNPDWGGGEDGSEPNGVEAYDPVLDVDNLVGDGPENINQKRLFDGEGFRVGVHHFRDNGHGPDTARVRIFVDGQLEFEAFETIECMQFWEVADINIFNDGTHVEIVPLDTEHFEGPLGHCGESGSETP